MRLIAAVLAAASLATGVLAQELTECADACIREAIAIGREQGCRNARDLECLCTDAVVASSLRECAYAECDQEGVESIIDYAFGLCEEAGFPITIETGRPTADVPAPTATEAPAEPTKAEAPEPTGAAEEDEVVEEEDEEEGGEKDDSD